MIGNLKALVVVLVLALVIFALAKPLCLRFMAADDFARRRNLWFALTVAAFVSPSFWLYVLVAVPLLWWVGARDSNPMALYFIAWYVIPAGSIEIPTVLINKLFALDNFRLLSIVLLLPVAVRELSARSRAVGNPFRVADVFVIAYGALQLLMFMPYESITNTMRRTLLYGLDMVLVFYVFSRLSVDRRRTIEAIATLCLGVSIMAAIGLFEFARGWLLYQGINETWGNPNVFAWILRGDDLRAQASAGHALVLGYVSAMAFGLWLYLQRKVASLAVRLAVIGIFWAGLIASISRGPWLVAVLVYLSYSLLAPITTTRMLQKFTLIGLITAAVLISPYGAGIVDRLPFIGSVDEGTVDYRQQLVTVSWRLIQENPFFGNPFVLLQLEELRQGQGIIDLINGYVSILLYHGLIGLTLFLGFFAVGLWGCVRHVYRCRASHPDTAFLGASIAACMIGTLLMGAVGSFGNAVMILYLALAGMSNGFVAQISQKLEVTRPRAIDSTRQYRPGKA